LYEALASQPADRSQDLQVLRWEALDFLRNNRGIQPYLKRERVREIDEKALDLYRGEISLFSDLSASFPVADLQAADRDRFLKLKEMFDPETSDTLFYRSVEKRFPSWRFSTGDDAVHFHSGIFQQSPFLLACARIRDRAAGSSFYFGCKFQFQDFFSASCPARFSSLRLPSGAAIVLSGPDGRPLPGSESAAKKRSVLSVPGRAALAGWKFQLRTDDSRIFSRLVLKTLRWYYTLIAALFASLGLGIVLLLRYLGNERRWLRQKAEFVDMTSHTLKTPLTRLRLLAEKLEQGWVSDAGRARENCCAIADETTHMAQLVDRMLDFSALQSGRASYRFEPRPVGEWLEGVLQKFKLPFAAKEFRAEVEIAPALPPVRIDPEAMGTALSNLVENVLQHAAAGKYIGISAAARDGCLEIAVSDRGPGVALEGRQPLFEPFLHGGGGKNSGRGLGLAICRQIVEAHGGAVRAEEAPGGGARFVIALPLELK
jgi:signal transduction histidine kinase